MDTTVATDPVEVGGVTIPSQRVYNIGLMDQRRNLLLASGLVALVGVVLVAVASLQQPERHEASAPPAEQQQMRECPHCAEPIKAAAVICRYCGRDVDPQPESSLEPSPDELYARIQTRYLEWSQLAASDDAFFHEESIAAAHNAFVESFEEAARAYQNTPGPTRSAFARSAIRDFPGLMENPRLSAAIEQLSM